MENDFCKRIRIVSFQNAFNFGAILQAYGLQEMIRSLGYEDVLFLNYNPKYLRDRYNPLSRRNLVIPKSVKAFVWWCYNYPFFFISSLRRNHKFRSSIQSMLKQTCSIKDENHLENEDVDVLICGSDQIWNPGLTGKFDPLFLGKGNFKRLGCVASYAPSTELSTLSEERARQLVDCLDSFKFLSVREEPIRDILKKYTNREIEVCVDPTILCGANKFRLLASSRIINEDYILVYAYDPDSVSIKEIIKSIPGYKKYSIHTILLGPKNSGNFFDKNIHSEILVQDFLSLVLYSSFVVTDSFHGLAFSLLFEKNFNVSYYEGKNLRTQSLLHQLGLDSRLVKNVNMIQWDDLDYTSINEKLSVIRNKSKEYLLKVLKG